MRYLPACSLYLTLGLLTTIGNPTVAQNPVGPEAVVNQTRIGRQMTPDVGVAADGSFVVVWADESAGRVWARRYGANGKPRGGEFRVSRLGDLEQSAPAVAVRPDGSFVVVWNRVRNGGKTVEVYASRFNANGLRVGDPRLVAFAGKWSADEPAAVVVLPDGGFFVAWTLEDGGTFWEDGDVPSRDLYGRRFTRDGVLVGGRVTLNADSFGDQRHPRCAVSQGKELLCTWTSELGEGWFGEIMFRRFDLNGLPLGNELQVNEEETSGWAQYYSSLAVRVDGTILIVWLDSGSKLKIFGRLLDASDQFVGASFPVATTEPVYTEPQAAAAGQGFAVVWTNHAQQLVLRRLSTAGAPVGGDRVINQRRDAVPGQPAVSFGPSGGAVVWGSFTEGFHEADIAVRRLR